MQDGTGHQMSIQQLGTYVLVKLVYLDNKATLCSAVITQWCAVFCIKQDGSFEQRTFIVEHYFTKTSFVLCQEGFPNKRMPDKTMVHNLIGNFLRPTVTGNTINHSPMVLSDDTL
jgi:hypothetical protein